MTHSSRRSFLVRSGSVAVAAAVGPGLRPGRLLAQTGAPAGAPDAYATPKPMNKGPYQPTWDSLRDNWRCPAWFNQAKLGIFIHWGLYSIPAHGNEWYERHMYQNAGDSKWHAEHYGPADKFGYKDFIPLFTAAKYDPAAWAELFKNTGARYVVPVAEHHDGFAMWKSDLTPWCAGKMGPKRDLTGELAAAVRKQNLIFGLSSHRMEHDSFAFPTPGLPTDENDPKYAGFYGPPIPGEFNNSNASQAFQNDWLARVQELVDKYEPQMIYFDNGVNTRAYDRVKLEAAAYYYNAAAKWGKEATLATKDVAYYFGSVQDFEKQQRAPKAIYNAPGWQVDDSIGSTWGYTDSMTVRGADSLAREMMELASMGGNLLLNVSPMGDGSIPENQQRVLLAFGRWMQAHGDGLYGARPWIRMGEGPSLPPEPPGDWKGGSTAVDGPRLSRARTVPPGEADFRFTTGKGALFAFGYKYPAAESRIVSLAQGKASVQRVALAAAGSAPLKFRQTPEALFVTLPPNPDPESRMPYALRIEGSLNFGADA